MESGEEDDYGWEGIKKNPNGFGYIRVPTENVKKDDTSSKEEQESALREIRLSPSIHRFRMYLNDWGAGEPVEESEIQELKELMGPEERESFHLLLSAFLAGEDVSGAINVDRKVEAYLDKIKDKTLYTQVVESLELIKLEEVEEVQVEDTIGLSKDLAEFCEKINQLKEEERGDYKREWIEKLLSFSVEEIMGTPEGNQMVEKLIIGADFDLVLEFIRKIRDDVPKLSGPEKEITLKVITQERCDKDKEETGKFIQEWFADGSHNKLLVDRKEFANSLKNICLKFFTIENLKCPQKVVQHELEVMRLCLQDPFTSLHELLKNSVSLEVFRVLGFARPFYNLEFISKEQRQHDPDSEDNPQMPKSVIAHCFSRLLKMIPDYPDSCYETLDKAIQKLVAEDILSQTDIFAVLKYRIVRSLSGKTQVPLSLVQGFVILIESLVKQKNLSDRNLIDEIIQFAVNLNRLLCLFTNSTSINYAPQIRDKIREILDYLKVPFGPITQEMENSVEDSSIFDQGILYARFAELRPLIKAIILDKKYPENSISFKEFLPVCGLGWVLNCTEKEWDPLAELIFDVIMSPESNLIRVKTVGKMYLLNEMLLFMYVCCVEKGSLQPFAHVQRFFTKAVDKIELNEECDWHELFNTLLMIGAQLSKSPRWDKKKGEGEDGEKKVSLDQNEKQVSLYGLLSYLVVKLDEFEKSGKSLGNYEKLRSNLDKFHVLNANCEPIRWMISERLEKLENNLCEA